MNDELLEQDPDEPYEPLHGIAERLRKLGEVDRNGI